MAANSEVGGSNLTAGGRNCFGEQLKYGSHVALDACKKNTFGIKMIWLGGGAKIQNCGSLKTL